MSFLKYYIPSDPLKPYVQSYTVFEEPAALAGVTLNIVPNGVPELAIHYGDPCESFLNSPGEVKRAYVYGPHKRAGVFRASGRVCCVCVLFKAEGFYCLFGLPQKELRDRAVDVNLVLGRDADDFAESIIQAGNADERVFQIEEFLLNRLKRPRERDSGIKSPLFDLLSGQGCVQVSDLSKNSGFSVKTLERRFKHDLGLTPKELGRIIRFNRLYAYLTGTGYFDWRAAVEKFGYYDQAHLINDFRRFLPLPPGVLMKDLSKHALFVNRIYSF